jgi:hypothetical protein
MNHILKEAYFDKLLLLGMQKNSKISTLIGALALAALVPLVSVSTPQAFAHERQLYTIGDQDYLIVIGSLNEPIFVDDKSGVDLRVLRADPINPMNSSAEGAAPVEGLEETVQVELAAGNNTRVLQLEPAFGEPGAYEAPFYPTVATTISYRLFGTINNTPVDLTFTCAPTGEAGAVADNSTVQVSEGVVRKGIEGGYGCPAPLTDAGFPEPLMSNNEIVTSLEQLQSDVQSMNPAGGSTSNNTTTSTPTT